ncbi:hypothetical protein VTJ49DRAFT_2548 [Mycothermus thermophilus]|uniref:DUF7918 domain-containing protein n=1 Tax=Humicola insolens TaxID=85995 RepID=A0ABR3V9V4_HUMIN
MAIISSVDDLDVTIVVDGHTAREYVDPDGDNANSCPMTRRDFHIPTGQQGNLPYQIKYIESKPGKRFAVSIRKGPKFRTIGHHIAFRIYVDGTEQVFVHQHEKETQDGVYRRIVDGFLHRTPRGDYTSYKFQFSELKTVEASRTVSASDLKKQMALVKECGTVKVEFFYMLYCPPAAPQQRPKDEYTPPTVTEVSEKALKGRAVDCATK